MLVSGRVIGKQGCVVLHECFCPRSNSEGSDAVHFFQLETHPRSGCLSLFLLKWLGNSPNVVACCCCFKPWRKHCVCSKKKGDLRPAICDMIFFHFQDLRDFGDDCFRFTEDCAGVGRPPLDVSIRGAGFFFEMMIFSVFETNGNK